MFYYEKEGLEFTKRELSASLDQLQITSLVPGFLFSEVSGNVVATSFSLRLPLALSF